MRPDPHAHSSAVLSDSVGLVWQNSMMSECTTHVGLVSYGFTMNRARAVLYGRQHVTAAKPGMPNRQAYNLSNGLGVTGANAQSLFTGPCVNDGLLRVTFVSLKPPNFVGGKTDRPQFRSIFNFRPELRHLTTSGLKVCVEKHFIRWQ
jgi:hypothetical protein